jgi:hypothetical protein
MDIAPGVDFPQYPPIFLGKDRLRIACTILNRKSSNPVRHINIKLGNVNFNDIPMVISTCLLDSAKMCSAYKGRDGVL